MSDNHETESIGDYVGRRIEETVRERIGPPILELGTRIVCEGKEFIVINYTLIRDHGGYLLRFEAQDPVLALIRQMEQEKARENHERAVGLLTKLDKELGEGEKWKEGQG